MPGYTLSFAAVASTLAAYVAAQDNYVCNPQLSQMKFSYPSQIPYQVEPGPVGRGPQFGYNLCNSTTEGPNSNCQTALINSIDDFCLWGPPTANTLIADAEAETVAFCTKPGHGARTIPSGTFTGLQFLKAPAYILIAGNINQVNINMQAGDSGGELDPHGADQCGNPLGGLVYSNGFPSSNGDNSTYTQVNSWHNFLGTGQVCFKICDPSVANSDVYCNNIFDETGCNFVAPASYEEGVFEVCESDNMDPVGVYTGSDGKTSMYSQPSVVNTLPSVRTPASSNCVTYTSSLLWADASSPTGSPSNSTNTASSTGSGTSAKPTGSTSASGTSKPSGSTSGKSSSGTSTSTSTSSGAAMRLSPMGDNALGFAPVLAIGVSIVAGLGAVVAGL